MYVNAKMRLVKTVPELGGRGDKGEQRRSEFNLDIFDTL
jgi:hypothetical protein